MDRRRRFFLLLGVAVFCLWAGSVVHLSEGQVRSWLERVPFPIAGTVFVGLYVGVTFFVWLGPKDLFRVVAAAFFGPYASTALVFIAEMINLLVFFGMSRRLGRDFVEERLPGRLKRWDHLLAHGGDGLIFLLRVFPVIPLRFLDLGLGLTRFPLRRYFVLAFLGTPIRIFVIQFFLALGVETITHPDRLQGYLEAHPTAMAGVLLYIVGSIITFWVLRRRTRRGRD